MSYTWHNFHYSEFTRLNETFSGKRIPGVAPHQLSTGLDINVSNDWKINFIYQYSDEVQLNDANTAAAESFHLLSARLSYNRKVGNCVLNLFSGAENLLDQQYSLGNDINAFGGRYYNAAPGRNFYVGINLLVQRNKRSL